MMKADTDKVLPKVKYVCYASVDTIKQLNLPPDQLKRKLEDIWNHAGVAFSSHFTRWSIVVTFRDGVSTHWATQAESGKLASIKTISRRRRK